MQNFVRWLTHPTVGSVLGFVFFVAVAYFVITRIVIPQMKKDGDFPPKIGKGK
jgi:hypothetical protein